MSRRTAVISYALSALAFSVPVVALCGHIISLIGSLPEKFDVVIIAAWSFLATYGVVFLTLAVLSVVRGPVDCRGAWRWAIFPAAFLPNAFFGTLFASWMLDRELMSTGFEIITFSPLWWRWFALIVLLFSLATWSLLAVWRRPPQPRWASPWVVVPASCCGFVAFFAFLGWS